MHQAADNYDSFRAWISGCHPCVVGWRSEHLHDSAGGAGSRRCGKERKIQPQRFKCCKLIFAMRKKKIHFDVLVKQMYSVTIFHLVS